MIPNSEKYNTFLNYLANVYHQAELDMLTIITNHLVAGIDSPDWVTNKSNEIATIRREVDRMLLATLPPARDEIINNIRQAYVTGYNKKNVDPFTSVANRDAIAALIDQITKQVDGVYLQILRAVDGAVRDVIAQTVANTLVGATTREIAASKALALLADKGIKGVRDKRGRNWGAAEYVEMATRTALTRSYAQGNINRYTDEDYKLVYIPTSPEPCPLCDPLENKVYSLEANDQYPTLKSAISRGLFHPNCTHRVVPYVKGLTKIVDRLPKKERNQHYEDRQVQRSIERDIRRWKRRSIVAVTDEDKQKSKQQIAYHQKKMRDFIKETGRLRSIRRENLGIKS